MTTTVLVIFNILICIGRGVGEGVGYSRKFYRGGFAPSSNPLPFYITFLAEKVPLSYTSFDKWYPCCKCTACKIGISHKTRMFSPL